MCQSVQAFTESSSSMKFLGVTVLVALIFLGGVNCSDSVVVNTNNLQVSCSVPIEDVWTDLSRGKISIKRLMLFQFYYSRVASLSGVLGTWSFHPVRFVLIGSLSNDDADGNENGKKAMVYISKKQLCTCITLFLYIS